MTNTKNEDWKLNWEYLEKSIEYFQSIYRVNLFAGKEVKFVGQLSRNKYSHFQALGNLGSFADDREIEPATAFIVISDSLINQLKSGDMPHELSHIEAILLKGKQKKGEAKKKKHPALLISEDVLTNYIEWRQAHVKKINS